MTTGGTGYFTQNDSSADSAGENIFVGNNGGTGTYTLDSGTLTVANVVSIGNNVGTYTQNGGTMTASGLGLGNGGGTGTYNLNLETLTTSEAYADGGNGFGIFNQSGGTFYTTFLNVGILGGGTGTYTMTGCNLDVAGNLGVGGSDAQGTFNQSVGTVQVSGSLYVNNGNTSFTTAGTYNLSGGSLTVTSDAYVSNSSGGTPGTGGLFDQTGGTTTYSANLHVGYAAGDTGTYDLTNGSTVTVSGYTVVGDGGTGTFLNDASTHNTQVMILGNLATGNGTYTLQDGGALNVGKLGNAGYFDVGENGTGLFNQTSGTTTIIGAFDIGRCGTVATATCNDGINSGTGNPYPYTGSSGTGTVTVNDADTTMTLQSLGVGDTGQGTFTQNNGTVTVNGGGLSIGSDAPFNDGYANLPQGNGTYNLNGGTLSLTGGEYVGNGGMGALNQSGGTNSVDSVVIGNASGSSGTYALSGGSLNASTTEYLGAAGTGTFTQDGGTNTAFSVSIGNNTGGAGTYNLTANSRVPTASATLLLSEGLFVGGAGQGTFNQSGALTSVTATELSVGNNPGGGGTYNLSAGSLTVNGTTYLGANSPSQGTITQTCGTASLNGDVILGNDSQSSGTYNLLDSNGA